METPLHEAWQCCAVTFLRLFSQPRSYKLAVQYIELTNPSLQAQALRNLIGDKDYANVNRAANLFEYLEQQICKIGNQNDKMQWLTNIATVSLLEQDAKTLIETLEIGEVLIQCSLKQTNRKQ